MDGFSREKIFRLCRAYHSLGIQEAAIIDVLFGTGGFPGDYAEIGRAIGRSASNTRKAMLRLENAGLIHIERGQTGRMRYCFLNDDWMDTLIKNFESTAK